MSRNRYKSDILSGIGTAFELVNSLKNAGIDDSGLRRLISDKRLVQSVAAVVTAPGDSDESFLALMADDVIDFVSPAFSHEMVGGWRHTLDHSLTYLFRPNVDYDESDLKGYGFPANLYDLIQYARFEWNGKDTVFAFGSDCQVFGRKHYPCISLDEYGMRHLDVVPASSRHTSQHFMLLPRY